MAVIQVEMDEGVIGTVYLSSVTCGPPTHQIEISGTEGTLEISGNALFGVKNEDKDKKILLLNDEQVFFRF